MSALMSLSCEYRRPCGVGQSALGGHWKLDFWFGGPAVICGFIRDGSTPAEVVAQLRTLADQIEGKA